MRAQIEVVRPGPLKMRAAPEMPHQAMPNAQKQKRFIELDFFRGLVLLVILVDHVGGSILSRFTLHTYAFNDAAEVFVFLGGYATAMAWLSLAERRGTSTARQYFVKRAFAIYRAFLITAALMLAISAAFVAFGIHAPNLASRHLERFIDTPLQTVLDVVLFRRQPYLAAVLPMYVMFALTVPVVVPLARRLPWLLAVASAALWLCAPLAGPWLPSNGTKPWDFNPFAWQLVFVFGVLARCHPIHQRVRAHRFGWIATAVAALAAGAFGYAHLCGAAQVPPPSFKQELGWLRVANFVAIAWLAADMTRLGWIARAARRLPYIGTLGRDGLACFVAGAAISLTVDSLLYFATNGLLHVPLGLAADASAIITLIAFASWRASRVQRRALVHGGATS
jgi:hypothetical protein